MSEATILDANFPPAPVADDAVGVSNPSLKPKVKIAKKHYGVWGDEGMTDEDFVDELKSFRCFNRDIIEL